MAPLIVEQRRRALTRGARAVADRARTFAQLTPYARPVLVNGAIGALIVTDGTPFALVDFTVSGRRITEIDVLADPGRLVRPEVPLVAPRRDVLHSTGIGCNCGRQPG